MSRVDTYIYDNVLVILVCMIVALILNLLPHQFSLLAWLWPDWLMLSLIYWALAYPYIGQRWAWALGLLQDIVLDVYLGTHVVLFAVVVFVCYLNRHRVRMYRRWQQAVWIGFLVALCQIIKLLLWSVFGNGVAGFQLLLPVVASVVLWGPVYLILRRIRRRYV